MKNILVNLTASKIAQNQLRYLPQSVRIEEAANPHIVRLTMFTICVAITIFLIWAALTHIKEIAKSGGEIVPEGFIQIVQHLNGGIITDIKVDEGSLVEKGQLLLVVDDGTTHQDLAKAIKRHSAFHLKAARLRALLDDVPLNTKNFKTQPTQAELDIAQKELKNQADNLHNLRESVKNREHSLTLAEESLKARENVFKQGYLSKVEMVEARQEYSNAQHRLSAAKAALAEYIKEAYDTLANTEDVLSQDEELIAKLSSRVERLQVISPVRGLVKGLDINTIGSVIKPGERLMEIVPLDKPLMARVQISPRDIGHVHIGQKVRLKIEAYEFTRYGTIEGTVKFLSATTFKDDLGKIYYRGHVELGQNYVGKDSSKNIIMPGMTVEAEILTGEKTVLAYLFKPVRSSLQTAFTER